MAELPKKRRKRSRKRRHRGGKRERRSSGCSLLGCIDHDDRERDDATGETVNRKTHAGGRGYITGHATAMLDGRDVDAMLLYVLSRCFPMFGRRQIHTTKGRCCAEEEQKKTANDDTGSAVRPWCRRSVGAGDAEME